MSLIVKIPLIAALMVITSGCAILADNDDEPVRSKQRGSLKGAMQTAAGKGDKQPAAYARKRNDSRESVREPDRHDEPVQGWSTENTRREAASRKDRLSPSDARENHDPRDYARGAGTNNEAVPRGNTNGTIRREAVETRDKRSTADVRVNRAQAQLNYQASNEVHLVLQGDDATQAWDEQSAGDYADCPDAYLRFKEMEREYQRPQMWQGCDGAYYVTSRDESESQDGFQDSHEVKSPNSGFQFSLIPVGSDSIANIREFSGYLESNESERASGVSIAIASYEFDRGSLQEQAIHDTISYGINIYHKGYMNSGRVFISPYWLIGVGLGELHWSYNTPIIDDDGYKIKSDSLQYADFRLGLGGELARYNGISLAVSATALWRFYDSSTLEGFENDMFSNHFSTAYGTSLTFRF